jgi:uncharacterized protein
MFNPDLKKNAQNSDANSRFELARMYHRGLGVPKDLKQAVRWYRAAAEQGLKKAQVQLASMYFRGEGMPVELGKAAHWYERAAEQDDKESMVQIAMMYAEGVGVEADLEKALEWFNATDLVSSADQTEEFWSVLRNSAADGSPHLKLQIANLLSQTSEGRREAIEWLRQGIAESDPDCCIALAHLLQGEEDNWEEALSLLQQARSLGLPEADAEIETFLQKAAQSGHGPSERLLALQYQSLGDTEGWLNWLKKACNHDCVEAMLELSAYYAETKPEHPAKITLLHRAAEMGSAEAAMRLYEINIGGEETERDLQAAIIWLTTAAETESQAQLQLGDCYYFGEAVDKDLQRAAHFYGLAAAQGNAQAQFSLASMLDQGDGIERNAEEAVKYYRMAAEAEHGFAQLYLAGFLEQIDLREAIVWYEKAAAIGVSEAQFRLAMILMESANGSSLDQEKSKSLLSQAAAQQHCQANITLARLILLEENPDKYKQAVTYLNAASEQGSAEAYHTLATLLLQGKLGNNKGAQAAQNFECAAKMGHAESQLSYGLMYLNGVGVKEDANQAALWVEKAAHQGVADAQYVLGMMFTEGSGKEQDGQQAVEWFHQAAGNGSSEACVMLARAYATGFGTDRDLSSAIRWCDQAAERGHADAGQLLEELRTLVESYQQS